MRRLLPILAAIAALLASSGTGVAVAREHHGERGRGAERGGPPPWAHGGERGERGGERGGGPPPWAGRGGGRWEQRQAAPSEGYGPPPGYYNQPRRGGYLPPQARGGVVQDYGRYRLRPPPPGYGWVRSGRAMMLMDMSTGQVFDVIPD
jgi:Ni/Co efflux regulator RcnB